MKILHIVSSYWPAFEFGGPIESVHQLNKWLVKNGVDVTVYTTNSGLRNIRMSDIQKLNSSISGMSDIQNIGKGKCEIDGIKIFYFPYYGYVHFTFSPSLFWEIGKNIKKFDLVHITGVWNFPVIVAAFWAKFYKKPYVISPRGSLMKEPLKKKSSFIKKLFIFLFIRRDLKNATAIHFTAEKEKEEYLRVGLSLKKAIIIPNGIDLGTSDVQKLNFREKFGIAADKKIILFLSRLNWKKGLDTLIPAFAEVIKKEPKAVLVLAGPDENNYRKEVLKIIDSINKRTSDVQKIEIRTSQVLRTCDVPNIIFTGMLLGDDKIVAYYESDVFVLPSYSENFGMAVVEAMVAELPVVITKGVGISKEVEKATAGIIIEKDANQLTLAILKILNNPDLAKKMGEAGRKLVEAEFSSEKVAEKWVKEYNKLL